MGIIYKIKTSISTFYLLYYFALLGLTLYLSNPNSLLPESWRIGFLVMSVLPVLYQKNLALFTIIPTLCVSLASFCPVLPTSSTFYLFVIPIIAFFLNKIKFDVVQRHIFFVLLYYLFISITYGDNIAFINWAIIAVFIVACINDKTDCELFSTAFMLTSIGICLLYIFFAEYFLVKIAADEEGGFERAQWLNPNMLAGMIDCGGIIAVGHLTKFFRHSIKSRIFLPIEILTVILVTVVNFINASRGGTFIFLSMVAIFSLFSKPRTVYKWLFVVGLVFLAMLAFNAGFMDTIIYRLNDDDLETISGRTIIAASKFNSFFESVAPLDMIFGIGQSETIKLGVDVSTHNDFLTSLIAFGFVGLALYLSIFYTIIKKTRSEVRAKILILLLFVFFESGTQEFFFRGELCIILFLLFIFRYFSIENDVTLNNRKS